MDTKNYRELNCYLENIAEFSKLKGDRLVLINTESKAFKKLLEDKENVKDIINVPKELVDDIMDNLIERQLKILNDITSRSLEELK